MPTQNSRYNAQLANNKFDSEQDAASAATFKLEDLAEIEDGNIGLQCRYLSLLVTFRVKYMYRCGGMYQGGRSDIEEALTESDVLLDCDTCSLQILVVNR